MNNTLLQELIDEPNWFVRLWIGGALYDVTATIKPLPQKEICLHDPESKYKNMRDLLFDFHLLSLTYTPSLRRTEMLKMLKNNFW